MKKLFTIAAVALMTVAGAAQSTETLYGAIEQFMYNSEVSGVGAENIVIKLSGSASMFNIASETTPIDLSVYKACKIEYSNASEAITMNIEQGEVTKSYDVPQDVSSFTIEFDEDVLALGSLTSLYISTWSLNQHILFNKAILIKNDGTEEVMTSIGGKGSGANIAIAQPEVKFTDAKGRIEIVVTNRKSIGIAPEYDEKSYIYTIEFEEPLAESLSVVCNNFLGTICTKEYPAGTTTITFDPADNFNAGDYSNSLYLQALDENATYPFTVKVKSMYRTEKNSGGTDGINSIKATSTSDNAVYTIGGQRASRNAKGLLIKNNRKYVK